MKKKTSPSETGLRLYTAWSTSKSTHGIHGDKKLLQALVNFKIDQGKKSTWNDLGCADKPAEILDSINHHFISLKSKQRVPKYALVA